MATETDGGDDDWHSSHTASPEPLAIRLNLFISDGDIKGVRACLDENFWAGGKEGPTWAHLKIALQKEDRQMTRLLCAWGAAPTHDDLIELQHSTGKYPQYVKAMRAAGLRNLPPPDAYLVPGIETPAAPEARQPAAMDFEQSALRSYSPALDPDRYPLDKNDAKFFEAFDVSPTDANAKLKSLASAPNSITGAFNMAANEMDYPLKTLQQFIRPARPRPPSPLENTVKSAISALTAR